LLFASALKRGLVVFEVGDAFDECRAGVLVVVF